MQKNTIVKISLILQCHKIVKRQFVPNDNSSQIPKSDNLGRIVAFYKWDELSLFTLAISKCYGKVRVLFFPRDNSLISRGNSHVSRVRGLVVRCLLFNPEVSCSNPWVCANFFTSIPKQKVLTFFGTMRLFGFVRLFFGFVRLFFRNF